MARENFRMVAESSMAGPNMQLAQGSGPYTPGARLKDSSLLHGFPCPVLPPGCPHRSFSTSQLSLLPPAAPTQHSIPARSIPCPQQGSQPPPSQIPHSCNSKLSLLHPTHSNSLYTNSIKHVIPSNPKSLSLPLFV